MNTFLSKINKMLGKFQKVLDKTLIEVIKSEK